MLDEKSLSLGNTLRSEIKNGFLKKIFKGTYLTLIPWLPCYITFRSHKNDAIIIVKLLYRATSRKRVAL